MAAILVDARREGIIYWSRSMKERTRQMKVPIVGIATPALRLKLLEVLRLHPHYYYPRLYNAEEANEQRFEYSDTHWMLPNAFVIVEIKEPAVKPTEAEKGYWDR
jgi:hypothetical protein